MKNITKKFLIVFWAFVLASITVYWASSLPARFLSSMPYHAIDVASDAKLTAAVPAAPAVLDGIIAKIKSKAVAAGSNEKYNSYLDGYLSRADNLENSLKNDPDYPTTYVYVFKYIYPRVEALKKTDVSYLFGGLTDIIDSGSAGTSTGVSTGPSSSGGTATGITRPNIIIKRTVVLGNALQDNHTDLANAHGGLCGVTDGNGDATHGSIQYSYDRPGVWCYRANGAAGYIQSYAFTTGSKEGAPEMASVFSHPDGLGNHIVSVSKVPGDFNNAITLGNWQVRYFVGKQPETVLSPGETLLMPAPKYPQLETNTTYYLNVTNGRLDLPDNASGGLSGPDVTGPGYDCQNDVCSYGIVFYR